MGLKSFLKRSSNETYTRNMELLEEHDLVNVLGSPNRLFLEFINLKNISIKEDELTLDLIEEFRTSKDFTTLKMAQIQKIKEKIFNERKIWINLLDDKEYVGTDLMLDHVGILAEVTNQKILYSQILDIRLSDGGWSKEKFIITTPDEELIFTVNEDYAVALKEILEDNISHENYDEFDELMDLYESFENGEISEEEFEIKKALLYSDELYCTNCGEKIDFDSRFCANCGKEIL